MKIRKWYLFNSSFFSDSGSDNELSDSDSSGEENEEGEEEEDAESDGAGPSSSETPEKTESSEQTTEQKSEQENTETASANNTNCVTIKRINNEAPDESPSKRVKTGSWLVISSRSVHEMLLVLVGQCTRGVH